MKIGLELSGNRLSLYLRQGVTNGMFREEEVFLYRKSEVRPSKNGSKHT